MRGIERPGDPRVVGALVGMVGGSAFVLLNRGSLEPAGAAVAVVVWLAVLAGTAYLVLFRQRDLTPPPRPAPRAGMVYGGSVAGMVLAIVLGSRLLTSAEHGGLVPALVALVVGLHFVPFAAAFAAPVFRRIGWTMAALGVAGLAIGFLLSPAAAAGAAVLAGLAMIAFIGLDARG